MVNEKGKGVNFSREKLPFLILLAVFALLPVWTSEYGRSIATQMLIYGLFSLSFNLLFGYAGLISFGHAAFWGVGGYCVGILLSMKIAESFWVILGFTILSSCLLGCLFGLLSLVTRGIPFVLINLALAELLHQAARKFYTITGGENGITNIAPPFGLQDIGLYYFILLFVSVCVLILWWIGQSSFGHILKGIRDNEKRMQALGYHTWNYLFLAYIIAGAFAGLGGLMFAYWSGIIAPESLSFWTTGNAVMMVIIGGAHYFIGPILGSIIIISISNFISTFTRHWELAAGIIIIFVVMMSREGVWGFIQEKLWKAKTQ